MKIPRFWAKGTANNPLVSCWGWSDVSTDDATVMAEQRTAAVSAILQSGRKPDRYLYSDRPLREEIIEEWKRPDGSTSVAITRNSYGCLVMNTTTIMFVDVDIPDAPPKGLFGSLFGKKGPDPRQQQENLAIEKVRTMVEMDSRCGVRIYRTKGGLRYLLTHSHTNPSAATTLNAMQSLDADPLYVTLCRVQECFRARLTPKPWRCNIPALRVRYPWADAEIKQTALNWVTDYSRNSSAYATCALVEHFGNQAMDDEIARAVGYHDNLTKAGSKLDLA